MAHQQYDTREPIVGVFEPGRNDILKTPAHDGFDRAWEDALEQADRTWRRDTEETIEVTVEMEARLDFWNPGGIGQYRIKISEAPGP
jgi:hypothetical protein